MASTVEDRGVDIVQGWLTSAGEGNPAGPLYSGGEHTEADLVSAAVMPTGFFRCHTTHEGDSSFMPDVGRNPR